MLSLLSKGKNIMLSTSYKRCESTVDVRRPEPPPIPALSGVALRSSEQRPGKRVDLVFHLENQSPTEAVSVKLAGALRRAGTSPWSEGDSVTRVLVTPGKKSYVHSPVIPAAASAGWYDVRWQVISDQGNVL